MRPLTFIFEFGTGSKCLRTDMVDPSWESHIRRQEMPDCYMNKNFWLMIFETFMLYFHVGEPGTRAILGVVEQLSVLMLLSTSFIYWRIKWIFPGEREAMHNNSLAVSSLMVKDVLVNTKDNTTQKYALLLLHTTAEAGFINIKFANGTFLNLQRETPVLVSSKDLRLVESHLHCSVSK